VARETVFTAKLLLETAKPDLPMQKLAGTTNVVGISQQGGFS
jgi:hypothetical protein